MLTVEKRLEVYKKVDEMIDMGNAHFGTDCTVPNTIFTKRGTVGGTANYSKMELNFNPGLMVDNWDEYINQIIPHEVAHIIKTHVYGSTRGNGVNGAHGGNWKRVMRALGVEPDRCHDMDVSKVKQFKSPLKKFIYVCPCCDKEVILSAVRHNRQVRGTHNYQLHRGNRLVLKESLGSMTYKEAHNRKVPGFIKEAAAEKKAKAPKTVKPGTKIAQAVLAYTAAKGKNKEITRQEMITVLADAMQVDRKAAAGYYQNCKKRAGE